MFIFGHIAIAAQFSMTMMSVLGNVLNFFTIIVDIKYLGVVQIPITLGSIKWQMRFEETNGQKERLLTRFEGG